MTIMIISATRPDDESQLQLYQNQVSGLNLPVYVENEEGEELLVEPSEEKLDEILVLQTKIQNLEEKLNEPTNRPLTTQEQEVQDVSDTEWAAGANQRILEGIKAEAFRRIRLVLPEWMVEREVTGGDPIPQDIKDQVAHIRSCSNILEENLTEDFTNNTYWE